MDCSHYLRWRKLRIRHEQEDITPWLDFIFTIYTGQAQQAQLLLENDQFEHLLSEKQL